MYLLNNRTAVVIPAVRVRDLGWRTHLCVASTRFAGGWSDACSWPLRSGYIYPCFVNLRKTYLIGCLNDRYLGGTEWGGRG